MKLNLALKASISDLEGREAFHLHIVSQWENSNSRLAILLGFKWSPGKGNLWYDGFDCSFISYGNYHVE